MPNGEFSSAQFRFPSVEFRVIIRHTTFENRHWTFHNSAFDTAPKTHRLKLTVVRYFLLRFVIDFMNDENRNLQTRTFEFSSAVLKMSAALAPGLEIGVIKRQLIRAATSVGANYRAACRAKSKKDFVSKLSIVEEEADECLYWISMLEEMGQKQMIPNHLKNEANEILAMIVASKKTAKGKL